MSSSALTPNPALAVLAPYDPARPAPPVDLHLDGNEGVGPSPELAARLVRMPADVLRRYPDAGPLEEELAARLGVARDRVLVTAGADEALDRVCRAVLAPGREFVLPSPTFELLDHYARLANATTVTVPWPQGAYPTAEVIAAMTARTALVAVVSPNNPTGAVATPADLEQVAHAAPRALVLADLAYAEFADEDLTATALALSNVVVTRTLSKAWGLAGLRIGYAVGPPEVIAWMRAAGGPYSVAGPSLAVALARLAEDDADVRAYEARVRTERAELAILLERLGARPLPSQANFVLAGFDDAAWTRDALAGLGISVRIFPRRPDLAGRVRITCPGEPGAFARLACALAAVLAPQALCLALDGLDERLRASRPLLERLARRLSLIVVTSRSRADANRLLAESGIADVVREAVCREDGRDPACLDRVGAARGWMVGGTPDDVRLARAAGMVPLGLVAPGEDDLLYGDALTRSGAARVLTRLDDLEELLP